MAAIYLSFGYATPMRAPRFLTSVTATSFPLSPPWRTYPCMDGDLTPGNKTMNAFLLQLHVNIVFVYNQRNLLYQRNSTSRLQSCRNEQYHHLDHSQPFCGVTSDHGEDIVIA